MPPILNTPRLDQLLRSIQARLDREGHGSKTALAREIGATKQKVQAWVNGTAKPNGEMALALLEWQERETYAAKKKRSGKTPAKGAK